MPINTARETTNRIAADVNVGVDTGDKAGAVTSVCVMVNLFDQFGWFWKIGTERAIVPLGRRSSVRFTR
ncbi:hypothetical protein [Microvirga sp. VF16]|uniref:hypothetical protein n=1 Tax=Microvirga sp. VF16 TaxID=2807101 RepID=UPI00193DF250|nr:hypothetical protein [Microvirga sp. VF16]QRM34096.1 hypothetical protein JO965_33055 [Microvirga sp. VF16]